MLISFYGAHPTVDKVKWLKINLDYTILAIALIARFLNPPSPTKAKSN